MRILHTADWHLGDRLGRIDRTQDLRQAVERIAAYCDQEQVDVLLVAGDLFSELSRPDTLRGSIEHLADVFLPFLMAGGTIVAVTGNHDNQNFCQTLRQMLRLGAPAAARPGGRVSGGRLYLASGPSLFRLAGRAGEEVQFVLMPYPTSRYLDDAKQRYASLEEKRQAFQAAYTAKFQALQAGPDFDPSLPSVLAAHIHVQGAVLPNLFRISEQESIIFAATDLPVHWAYVALGHIHQPQCLKGLSHIRYCGSIERLDLGEHRDQKSAVLVDIGPEGRRGDPVCLELESTPFYDITITNPREELPRLRHRYPDAGRALVRYHLTYTAGEDILNEVLAELDTIFPRWYDRSWREAGAVERNEAGGGTAPAGEGFARTVIGYLQGELAGHPDRDEVLKLADALLVEDDQ